ncbi:MAG: hypothetical protein CG439_673 [Methylococcaceae bacterium NSP1-2]|nr:hypothetical protein [Methylococcaceae bacterium]OYV19937.1 MAG: hypothetical protein CG439_673 [Methylococcaceae bacterium NSP1-2]
MKKTNKFLSLIGFSESQTMTFSAILSLAERTLKHSWRIVERDEADFFVLSTEKFESEFIISAKNLPHERCIFCTHQHRPERDYENNVLFISTGGLPQLSSLVKVLNYQATNINCSEQAPADNLSITPIMDRHTIVVLNDDDFFDPDRSFLKTLLENTTDFLIYRFTSPAGSIKLYVDFVKKIYYCETSLKDLKSYFFIKNAIIIDSVSEIEWHDAVEQATLPRSQPLANLIWYVAFELSNGRLLYGHSDQDNVYLTRWPDLGVEGCGKYIKLAAFMRNNVTNLTVTASKTNVPLPAVYSFYNACYLIGIVEKAGKSELYAKVLDEDKQQLLEKITNRLKEINNHKEAAE